MPCRPNGTPHWSNDTKPNTTALHVVPNIAPPEVEWPSWNRRSFQGIPQLLPLNSFQPTFSSPTPSSLATTAVPISVRMLSYSQNSESQTVIGTPLHPNAVSSSSIESPLLLGYQSKRNTSTLFSKAQLLSNQCVEPIYDKGEERLHGEIKIDSSARECNQWSIYGAALPTQLHVKCKCFTSIS